MVLQCTVKCNKNYCLFSPHPATKTAFVPQNFSYVGIKEAIYVIKHFLYCMLDGCSGCLVASSLEGATVHLPLWYGPLYFSTSVKEDGSLVLL